MARFNPNDKDVDFNAVRLAVASPDDILKWSYGEVTKPETINYRTQKPERDGLFCERIFGPIKDINPHDSKLKGVRSREAAIDKNGEVVTKSVVRRERMGHIELASPVAHIWFMRGTPSAMSLLLGMTVRNIERIVYFASYVILNVDEEKRDQMLKDLEATTVAARAAIKIRYEKQAETETEKDIKELAKEQSKELEELENDYRERKKLLESLTKGALVSEVDRGKRDFFAFDVHPDVHLGEVRERKNTEVFARVFASVEEVPKLGALVFRIPLMKTVTKREYTFFGT